MIDRPTPETDVFSVSFKSIDDPLGKKQWVPVDIARKLERERDEAREAATEQFIAGGKAIRERDEARRKLNDLNVTAIHSCHNECQRPVCVLRRERDEAREEANKLSGAYEDATNYYARIIELKEELDEAKEALAKILKNE
jgi:hypothetical protein